MFTLGAMRPRWYEPRASAWDPAGVAHHVDGGVEADKVLPLYKCHRSRCGPTLDGALAQLIFHRSLQSSVFCLSLLEDRDIAIGVFPKGEEIFVGSLCLDLISRKSEGST